MRFYDQPLSLVLSLLPEYRHVIGLLSLLTHATPAVRDRTSS